MSEFTCLECGSKNVYFDEKYFQLICRNCLRIYNIEDIIKLEP